MQHTPENTQSRRRVPPDHAEVLRRVYARIERYRDAWLLESDERGSGALVFRAREPSTDPRETEFWSVPELRHHVRTIGGYDEGLVRWLDQVERSDAFPVVILSTNAETGEDECVFYALRGGGPAS